MGTRDISKKIAVLMAIKDKKDILFGSFSSALEKTDKVAAWNTILNKAQSMGLAANKDHKYVRDKMYGLWKSRTLAKKDNRKKTGTAGGKAVQYDGADEIILDIIGRDSPAADGLPLEESRNNICPANEDISKEPGVSNESAASKPVEVTEKNKKTGSSPPKRRRNASLTYFDDKAKLTLELLELEIYNKRLKAFKLERDLGIPPSSFTNSFVMPKDKISINIVNINKSSDTIMESNL